MHRQLLGVGPAVQPVADELGIGERQVRRADGGRGADEHDADGLGPARHLDRRTAPAHLVGHQPGGLRGVGHVAVGRPGLAAGRIVEVERARRMAQEIVLAGIAGEGRVPRLEHVGRAELHAADVMLLDVVEHALPFGVDLAPVGQRRRLAEEPFAVDAGGERKLVEHRRVDGRAALRVAERHGEHLVAVDVADGCFGNEDADDDRRKKQQDVLQLQGAPMGRESHLAQNSGNASRMRNDAFREPAAPARASVRPWAPCPSCRAPRSAAAP